MAAARWVGAVLAALAAGAAPAARPQARPGAAWHLVAARAHDFPITYAGFVDERTGITVGVHGRVTYTTDGGGLWRTDDAGASWWRARSPLQGQPFQVAARAQTAYLRFTPAGEGALAAFVRERGRWRCRVWRAAAGTEGWSPEAVPLESPGTLFLSPDARVLTWKSADRDELRVYAW
jgi:hypothetical protein